VVCVIPKFTFGGILSGFIHQAGLVVSDFKQIIEKTVQRIF